MSILLQCGNYDLVKQLLETGADPNFVEQPDPYFYNTDPSYFYSIHREPLAYAATKEAIELLLRYGANAQKLEGIIAPLRHYQNTKKSRRTSALLQNTLDAINILLHHGARLNCSWRHSWKNSALLAAVDSPLLDTQEKEIFLRFFVRHGTNSNNQWFHDNPTTIYDRLEKNEKRKPWAQFIRNECQRWSQLRWQLVRPFLAALYKEQPEDCHLSKLPAEIIEPICKQVIAQAADSVEYLQ